MLLKWITTKALTHRAGDWITCPVFCETTNKRAYMDYIEFLTTKIAVAEKHGIKVDASELHPSSLPHQKKIVPWALEMGAGLIATDAGSGKTHMGIETLRLLKKHVSGRMLVVTELAAMDTWDSVDMEVGEGVRLGVDIQYVRDMREVDTFGRADGAAPDIYVTNYERVRDGGIDLTVFTGVWLDEGNYVKNIASETTDTLRRQLKKVQYKWIATATPCPNELLEIINYADVLGICDRGQVLTRFFQRNSTKAGELTLHPQHAEAFYVWLFSWSVWMTVPSDIGLPVSDDVVLPPLVVNWHLVPFDEAIDGLKERDGQGKMFADTSTSLPEAARVKKATMNVRLDYAMGIIAQAPEDHYIIWHHLEAERLLLYECHKDMVEYGQIYGKQDWELRSRTTEAFIKGELKRLATKPDVSGVGCNFQKHCHRAIAMGINHSWDEFYQAIIKRLHRYGQKHEVVIDVLYTSAEAGIVDNLKRKWKEHDELREIMAGYQKRFGLGNSRYIEEKRRSFHEGRKEYKGGKYTLVNTDCVFEWQNMPENSVDMILSSFPFGNHYEYTDKYNDFGHNTTNREFFNQMDYLIPHLLRTLKPGRIAAIHLKNRIHYGSVTGLGFSTFHRFTHWVCDAMEKHGFHTLGFHYIPTCVVAENNQTYRLAFGEMQKDSTKMGSGIPEEIWLFRKAPTSNENAYADVPVTHNLHTCPTCERTEPLGEYYKKDGTEPYCVHCKEYVALDSLVQVGQQNYELANWQIDADAFWHSSGNRLLTPDELVNMDMKKIRAWWNRWAPDKVYDYEGHVQLLKELDKAGKLSRTFTTLPMRSMTPYVWNDVNRMQGLNTEQRMRKRQNHICPMPFDEVDRLIGLYSNLGDLVADPFGGVGTTGVRALKLGRRAYLTELNPVYAACAAQYMAETEKKKEIPTLFDMVETAA